jgi:hypothetical protein
MTNLSQNTQRNSNNEKLFGTQIIDFYPNIS